MKAISVKELKSQLEQAHNILLVDVRENYEHEAFNIGGIHIPLADIISQSNNISRDTQVVVYCKKGIRSQIAIQRLEDKFDFTNLYNLTGGMEEWQKI